MSRASILILQSLLMATLLYAETPAQRSAEHRSSIRINGRKASIVTTARIKLGDIAEINSPEISDDHIIVALQNIELENSPAPGESTTISASSVLTKLEMAGVNLSELGYIFPRVFEISRAARKLTEAEVKNAIEEQLKSSVREISVKSISYDGTNLVSPGVITLEARPNSTNTNGQMGFQIVAKVDGEIERQFNVLARVEEWIEVPVAKHAINKGSVVSDEDIQKERMNLAKLPKDAAHDEEGVLGYELGQNVGYGEVFRRAMLKIPPVINQGSQVTILYRSGLLEASATGTALETGIQDQFIKVKNDASKKVIVGKVVEPGLVRIVP